MTSSAARHSLHQHALQTWGAEPAHTLMDLLPQDPDALATKDDLRVLGSELRTEMAELRTELRTEMADLRTELRSEIAGLTGVLHSELGAVRREATANTRAMLISYVATTVTLVAAMMALVG